MPVDAVTTSASGVDPHISEANARIQARRVAEVRRLPVERVNDLIDENTDGRQLGFLGEPGVNVLELNLALDRESSDDLSTSSLRADREPREARPAAPDPQPGDVRGRDRRGDHHDRMADPGLRRRPAGRRRRAGLVQLHRGRLAVAHGHLREPGRGTGRGPRQGPGQGAAGDAHGDRGAPARRRREAGLRAPARRRGGGRGGRADPGRRHRDRGHRLGGRVRHHGRVRPGDPRVRRRPQRGDRRYPGALRPDRGGDHPGAGRQLPRPDDRAGRGRRASQDARTRSPWASCSRA